MITKLSNNIWTAEQPFKLLGSDFGKRMTIIKTDAGLILHSPIGMTEELRELVETLGPVSYLIAPNSFHHLHLKNWVIAYPNAQVIAPSAVAIKQPTISVDQVIEPSSNVSLPSSIDYVILQGRKDNCELILFDKTSSVLIVTDLIFNLKARNLFEKILFFPFGIKSFPSSSRLFKFFYGSSLNISEHLKTISSWPIQKIILSHGDIIQSNAMNIFARATEWAHRS